VSYNTTLNPEAVLHADSNSFPQLALEVFRYQHEHNAIYRQYCDALNVDAAIITSLTDIPFLPISFFKTHKIVTGNKQPDLVFESSGTTADIPSKHYIADVNIYKRSLLQGFEAFYGPAKDHVVLALLPSYLERKNASLVYMAKTLMEHGGHTASGFYIDEWEQLHAQLQKLQQSGQKVLLLGVTFALLDFAAAYPMQLTNTIVMETGGMKGRCEELTRDEVHAILKKQWQLQHIHSEYGMTELLSQAYATTGGIFKCTNTMRVFVRDINDPLEVTETGTGALNIIDLANIHSCSFIATEDIGSIAVDGTFRVLGRLDHSALRGCSLMTV
jgi:phenylacetate-coenzyme A ligase PaaK-like adenylate-forming protein